MIGGAAGRRVVARGRSCEYGAPMDTKTAGALRHQLSDPAKGAGVLPGGALGPLAWVTVA
jgi:hypothetical protein